MHFNPSANRQINPDVDRFNQIRKKMPASGTKVTALIS
jgi:hypothetical protein